MNLPAFACTHIVVAVASKLLLAVMQGLGEDITKPKSRLEREKEAAAAAAAKAGSTSDMRKFSLSVRSKVAEAWQGQGLESVLQKRKSKLEQDKENAAAAAAATNISPKDMNKPVAAARSAIAVACVLYICAGMMVEMLSYVPVGTEDIDNSSSTGSTDDIHISNGVHRLGYKFVIPPIFRTWHTSKYTDAKS